MPADVNPEVKPTLIETFLIHVLNNNQEQIFALVRNNKKLLSSVLTEHSELEELKDFPVGTTALMIAAANGHDTLVGSFFDGKYGCTLALDELKAKDSNGRNVFDWILNATDLDEEKITALNTITERLFKILRISQINAAAELDYSKKDPLKILTAEQARPQLDLLGISDVSTTDAMVRAAERGLTVMLKKLIELNVPYETAHVPTLRHKYHVCSQYDPLEAATVHNRNPILKYLLKDIENDYLEDPKEDKASLFALEHILDLGILYSSDKVILGLHANLDPDETLEQKHAEINIILSVLSRTDKIADLDPAVIQDLKNININVACELLRQWHKKKPFTKQQLHQIFEFIAKDCQIPSRIYSLMDQYECDPLYTIPTTSVLDTDDETSEEDAYEEYNEDTSLSPYAFISSDSPLIIAITNKNGGSTAAMLSELIVIPDAMKVISKQVSELVTRNDYKFSYMLNRTKYNTTTSLLAGSVLLNDKRSLAALLQLDESVFTKEMRLQQLNLKVHQPVLSGERAQSVLELVQKNSSIFKGVIPLLEDAKYIPKFELAEELPVRINSGNSLLAYRHSSSASPVRGVNKAASPDLDRASSPALQEAATPKRSNSRTSMFPSFGLSCMRLPTPPTPPAPAPIVRTATFESTSAPSSGRTSVVQFSEDMLSSPSSSSPGKRIVGNRNRPQQLSPSITRSSTAPPSASETPKFTVS